MKNSLRCGIDQEGQLLALRQKRLGLITNDVACNAAGIPSRKALTNLGLNLSILFSPEHGLSATCPDGEKVGDLTDTLTGLPVKSLYAESFGPSGTELKQLDALLFDIPDAGSRFYTYLWTMTYAMEACAEAGIPFYLLDRPNPLGGNLGKCEGPMLDEKHCSSFIGRWQIPIRHGCTLGELARYFTHSRLPHLQLHIIPCSGWHRHQTAIDTDLHFRPTSPAITDAETALLYAGMGLLEGINVNEGRGTGFPFKQMGAPWIQQDTLIKKLMEIHHSGIRINTTTYKPSWGLYAGIHCNGLRFAVTNPESFRPVAFAIHLIQTIMQLFPDNVKMRLYPTVANPSGENHLDRLTGVHQSFRKLMDKASLPIHVNPEWSSRMEPYLLYD